ncbi:hypothetical protein KKH23_00070 [Patescibacteria group bacterium]|nr:hypothetical protein [Patescibacteria group bacterium]MBU0776983.1 hypothetical protein [Patescibacteria group bacterium]MBU0845589.1 hypothetical protein [Patescibacteria group bacterium]MBU0923012.1 hypothetical protein [Patescibacteria group bacterium]MBU1066332.1 hypothetical protein [Patescibacteria group bacterium]
MPSSEKIIRIGKKKIPYIEISSEMFKKRHSLINPLSLEDFNEKFSQSMFERLDLNVKEFPEKFRFRFFHLEENPAERKERLEKISVHGSDRTNPSPKLKTMPGYVSASSASGVEQIYLFDCGSLPHFSQNYSEEKHNALLIYDSAKICYVEGVEYTFKDMSDRGRALLAIVALI